MLFLILCVSIISCKTRQPANDQNEKQVTQELITLEKEWQKAFERKDTAFISRLLADDFITTYGDGSRGNKPAELSEVFSTEEQMESVVADEYVVKSYDNFAIVLFKVTSKGIRHEKPFEGMFRYMDVFKKVDGRWQCIASQNTRIGKI